MVDKTEEKQEFRDGGLEWFFWAFFIGWVLRLGATHAPDMITRAVAVVFLLVPAITCATIIFDVLREAFCGREVRIDAEYVTGIIGFILGADLPPLWVLWAASWLIAAVIVIGVCLLVFLGLSKDEGEDWDREEDDNVLAPSVPGNVTTRGGTESVLVNSVEPPSVPEAVGPQIVPAMVADVVDVPAPQDPAAVPSTVG